MYLNRNLNTVFYAVIAVSYIKKKKKIWKRIPQSLYENKPFFLTFSIDKREKKSVAGHESDKLVEWYSVEPADRVKIRVIFDYQAIYKHKMSRSRSVQPVLTDVGLIISSTFSFYDCLSFHHPQQQIQFCQMPSNVKLRSLNCSRHFISVSVFHS